MTKYVLVITELSNVLISNVQYMYYLLFDNRFCAHVYIFLMYDCVVSTFQYSDVLHDYNDAIYSHITTCTNKEYM